MEMMRLMWISSYRLARVLLLGGMAAEAAVSSCPARENGKTRERPRSARKDIWCIQLKSQIKTGVQKHLMPLWFVVVSYWANKSTFNCPRCFEAVLGRGWQIVVWMTVALDPPTFAALAIRPELQTRDSSVHRQQFFFIFGYDIYLHIFS